MQPRRNTCRRADTPHLKLGGRKCRVLDDDDQQRPKTVEERQKEHIAFFVLAERRAVALGVDRNGICNRAVAGIKRLKEMYLLPQLLPGCFPKQASQKLALCFFGNLIGHDLQQDIVIKYQPGAVSGGAKLATWDYEGLTGTAERLGSQIFSRKGCLLCKDSPFKSNLSGFTSELKDLKDTFVSTFKGAKELFD